MIVRAPVVETWASVSVMPHESDETIYGSVFATVSRYLGSVQDDGSADGSRAAYVKVRLRAPFAASSAEYISDSAIDVVRGLLEREECEDVHDLRADVCYSSDILHSTKLLDVRAIVEFANTPAEATSDDADDGEELMTDVQCVECALDKIARLVRCIDDRPEMHLGLRPAWAVGVRCDTRVGLRHSSLVSSMRYGKHRCEARYTRESNLYNRGETTWSYDSDIRLARAQSAPESDIEVSGAMGKYTLHYHADDSEFSVAPVDLHSLSHSVLGDATPDGYNEYFDFIADMFADIVMAYTEAHAEAHAEACPE